MTDTHNILARDMNFNIDPTNIAAARFVKNSSYAVLHQIDNYLNFISGGGRFDKAWSSASAARKFMAKYKIRK